LIETKRLCRRNPCERVCVRGSERAREREIGRESRAETLSLSLSAAAAAASPPFRAKSQGKAFFSSGNELNSLIYQLFKVYKPICYLDKYQCIRKRIFNRDQL